MFTSRTSPLTSPHKREITPPNILFLDHSTYFYFLFTQFPFFHFVSTWLDFFSPGFTCFHFFQPFSTIFFLSCYNLFYLILFLLTCFGWFWLWLVSTCTDFNLFPPPTLSLLVSHVLTFFSLIRFDLFYPCISISIWHMLYHFDPFWLICPIWSCCDHIWTIYGSFYPFGPVWPIVTILDWFMPNWTQFDSFCYILSCYDQILPIYCNWTRERKTPVAR